MKELLEERKNNPKFQQMMEAKKQLAAAKVSIQAPIPHIPSSGLVA